MRVRRNQGRVFYQPLSFVFQVVPQGGSFLQKYDAPTQVFIPDRELTPLVLTPSLIITDPDHVLPTADYASRLVNASWVLTLTQGNTTTTLPATSGGDTNYSVNANTKELTLYYNVNVGNILHVLFRGDYVDTRRNEVFHFKWGTDLTCEAQTSLNVTLDTGQWKNYVHLLPFKKWGNFGIPVQLKNGPDEVPDAQAVYQWEWWDEVNSIFSSDFTDCPWLVSGQQTKEIVVAQDFIQKLVLRVKAYAYGNQHTMQYFTTKLQRWYGQFDYDIEFARGKYIFKDTDTVVLETWIANAKGLISNITKYFDVEVFFAVGNNTLESVGYGEEVIIKRNDLALGEPKCGVLIRELSAFRGLCLDNGNALCLDNGNPLMIQVPTKSREV